MKKNFKFYALIWLIMVATFNVIVFFVRPLIPGYDKTYDVNFWIPFAFIFAAFVGNLICTYFAFKPDNLQKLFYNISLVAVSWSALLILFVAGSIFLVVPDCPLWIAAIVCIVLFAINAICVIKAVWAASLVGPIDEKVKAQTAFIKNLTVDAESLLARAKSDDVKAECKKVYEAARYSDPMSNSELSAIEAKITVKVGELSSAVEADEAEKVKEIAEEAVRLIGDRNNKCKALK